jgi:DNA-binding transcriptional ArsR family regulator
MLFVDRLDQAEALLKPQRIEVLRELAEPRSCTEVGARLGQTPQRVYYHVKRLVEAGLVVVVTERRVRGIMEGIYQATARSYWLSPALVGTIGKRQSADQLSLGYLINLVEEVQAGLAALDGAAEDMPLLGISGEVRLSPKDRQAFLDDLRTAMQDVFRRYGSAEGETFRIALAAYPHRPPAEPAEPVESAESTGDTA